MRTIFISKIQKCYLVKNLLHNVFHLLKYFYYSLEANKISAELIEVHRYCKQTYIIKAFFSNMFKTHYEKKTLFKQSINNFLVVCIFQDFGHEIAALTSYDRLKTAWSALPGRYRAAWS